MASLAIGDHVTALDGSHPGKLVEIDDGIGYVLQPNGVEVEYPLGRLKPYEAPKPVEQRTLSGPLRDRALSAEQTALLASVPPALMDAIARSYEQGDTGGARPRFAALPPSKQLDAIRIHLPTLAPRLIAPHMKLVLAVRELAKPRR